MGPPHPPDSNKKKGENRKTMAEEAGGPDTSKVPTFSKMICKQPFWLATLVFIMLSHWPHWYASCFLIGHIALCFLISRTVMHHAFWLATLVCIMLSDYQWLATLVCIMLSDWSVWNHFVLFMILLFSILPCNGDMELNLYFLLIKRGYRHLGGMGIFGSKQFVIL